MSELLKLIDAYRDEHGQPSDASVARALGIAPQTLSSWRKRGIRELPELATLRRLAQITRRDYGTEVLPAVLYDIKYIDEMPQAPGREEETA